MISFKDYALKNNISYEAVRKQVSRYKSELSGHIIKIGRTQYLDDEAVLFLDDKRINNPIVIYEASKDDELHKLADENRILLLKVADLQDQLIQTQKQLIQEKEVVKQLQTDKILLLEKTVKSDPIVEQPSSATTDAKTVDPPEPKKKKKHWWNR